MVHAKLGLKQTQDLKKKTFQTTVCKKVEREIKKNCDHNKSINAT